MWLPVVLGFVLLDVSFDAYFWRIPKTTRITVDPGYQFLIDRHLASQPLPKGVPRVLAFGSSISRSFNPQQVRGLSAARAGGNPPEVHRLLMAGIKPSDWRLLFSSELDRLRPDVAVVLFNLLDFLNPSFEREFKPHILAVLPPAAVLRERFGFLSGGSEKLDVLLAGASRLYRYRRPIRYALRDHVRLLPALARARPPDRPYGVYPDGYARKRFGVPFDAGPAFEFEYEVDPEWIRQRGRVELRFDVDGREIGRRTETTPGWKSVRLPVEGARRRLLDVWVDGEWTPAADGRRDDSRLLGPRVRRAPDGADRPADPLAFGYPPVDPMQVRSNLGVLGRPGADAEAQWSAYLGSEAPFAQRMRAYRDAKRAALAGRFEAGGEFAEMEALVRDLVRRHVAVVLVNTPENPLLRTHYANSRYYADYLAHFEALARRHPQVSFVDLHEALPVGSFLDLHHVNYIGELALGPRFAEAVAAALAGRATRGAGS